MNEEEGIKEAEQDALREPHKSIHVLNEEERIREEMTRILEEWQSFMRHKLNTVDPCLIVSQILSIKGIYTEKDIKEAEKAGIQKVVDWIQREESNCMDCSTPYKFTLWDWQAFLKEVEK